MNDLLTREPAQTSLKSGTRERIVPVSVNETLPFKQGRDGPAGWAGNGDPGTGPSDHGSRSGVNRRVGHHRGKGVSRSVSNWGNNATGNPRTSTPQWLGLIRIVVSALVNDD